MVGLILQKGSFNPLHRMHKAIAEDAIKGCPGFQHVMLMSRETCDKGVIPQEELDRRAVAIREAGFFPAFEDSGLFIDSIALYKHVYGKGTTIVFPVGEDTIYRFFRDWEAYHDEHSEGAEKYEEYIRHFQGVIWIVSERDCSEREQYKDLLDDYMIHHPNVVWSDLNLDSISSTKIRNGECSY